MDDLIPFNHPGLRGRELTYIRAAMENLHVSGNGPFGERCARLMESSTGCRRAFLTPSGSAALEMAALVLDLQPGDEVIVPSFTFPTSASAFVLRGAVPVFVDVREDTMNLDERLVESAITNRTRALIAVHYAGVGCDMQALEEIARRHGLALIEDAAQGVDATYRGRPLGSFGQLAAVSFHETKNVICGEGGALLLNDAALEERAEIIQEKGTNRSAFFRGDVDKYTWVDLGSSYLMSDINAAFLLAQLEDAGQITRWRMGIWRAYHEAFAGLEDMGLVRRPTIPSDCGHNAHMYYLLLAPQLDRDDVISRLRAANVHAVFHYVPLHSSPAGLRFGRASGSLDVSTSVSERLIRLPLWFGMDDAQVALVIAAVQAVVSTVAEPASAKP